MPEVTTPAAPLPVTNADPDLAKLRLQEQQEPEGAPLDWTSTLIISGAGVIDPARPTIVAEVRNDDGSLATPAYPTGAALYVASGVGDDSATFPAGAVVLALGDQIEQGLLSGFSAVPGVVHVGPAHPAYAAANVAWQNGATTIEIKGLSDKWKGILQTWFNKLPTDNVAPAQNVTINLT